MMVMSTTHLGIEFLDSISLSDSSLVRTKLAVKHRNCPYSLLGKLVHLLFRVITTGLYYECERITFYLENIHHVLLIRKKSSNLTDELTDGLHSLRAGL